MSDFKKNLIEQLKPLTKAIVDMFGPNCEALIHDLSDLEHSIVWIEGDVTHRKIGGPITDVGLAQLKENQDNDYINYVTSSADGKVLKSTSVIFRDERGQIFASLCINLDITPFQAVEHILHGITGHPADRQYTENFSDDINEILETIVYESEREIGKSITAMNKEEKVALVQKMDERGAFQIKKAVPLVARRLGVSRYTVYNYLNEIKEKLSEQPEENNRYIEGE